MGDRSGMSISADSSLDETLNRGPLALLLWRQFEFLYGIDIAQFSIFKFSVDRFKVVILQELVQGESQRGERHSKMN